MDEQTLREGQHALAETFGARDAITDGVAVVDGFGITVTVERGHLAIVDGIGRHRRERRFPRADRELRRLVILGRSGMVTLDALRWCDDVGVFVVALDDDGRVLYTSTVERHDDARLRRAQALAAGSAVGVAVGRSLLAAKLAGQAATARQLLAAPAAADTIESLAAFLDDAETVDDLRRTEAQAAAVYFGTFVGPAVRFRAADRPKVPTAWERFDTRLSPVTSMGANRRAATPFNALLNYCFALAEIECHRAAMAVGLDPGFGVIHTDRKGRQSMALDLLEPIRPAVERIVLRLVRTMEFAHRDFAELPTGEVRLLAPLTHHLAANMVDLARAAAPVAEEVASMLVAAAPGSFRRRTPLTQASRRRPAAQLPFVVNGAEGTQRRRERTLATHAPGWTDADFASRVMPALAARPLADLMAATGCSKTSASRIRGGRAPHPRSWAALAVLAGVTAPADGRTGSGGPTGQVESETAAGSRRGRPGGSEVAEAIPATLPSERSDGSASG